MRSVVVASVVLLSMCPSIPGALIVTNDGEHNIGDVVTLVQAVFGTLGVAVPAPTGAVPEVGVPDGPLAPLPVKEFQDKHLDGGKAEGVVCVAQLP